MPLWMVTFWMSAGVALVLFLIVWSWQLHRSLGRKRRWFYYCGTSFFDCFLAPGLKVIDPCCKYLSPFINCTSWFSFRLADHSSLSRKYLFFLASQAVANTLRLGNYWFATITGRFFRSLRMSHFELPIPLCCNV